MEGYSTKYLVCNFKSVKGMEPEVIVADWRWPKTTKWNTSFWAETQGYKGHY